MLSESRLQQLITDKHIAPLRFADSLWLIDSRAALYWPEQDCLLIADLHLEKGSYLSQYASPLPRYDSRATLRTIESLLDTYQPETVLCLGDSFHDLGAYGRLLAEDIQYLQTILAQAEQWVWVVGNHDPHIPTSIGGKSVTQFHLTTAKGINIVCQHIPDSCVAIQDATQIVGHYHPKGLFSTPARRFRGKCLINTESLMILPALGQYTGGLSIDDEIMKALAPVSERQCFMLCERRVVAMPSGS